MHRSDPHESARCADCGAEVAVGTGRAAAVTETLFLCFACAMKRGGRYDERLDRWDVAPDAGDLLRDDA
jgi:hypothetical protein